MQRANYIRISTQSAALALVFIFCSSSATRAQTTSSAFPSSKEQRIQMFQQNRSNSDKSQAENELLAWPDDVTKDYWDWRNQEIDSGHLEKFRRNRANLNENQADEERLDWPSNVMRQYWKWRNIESDAKYIETKKRADAMAAKYIETKSRADATHAVLVKEYERYIQSFLEYRELQGRPGFDTRLYEKMRTELRSVLSSGHPQEVLPKVQGIRQFLE